ncbi:MAG: FHA domain-containing protein [Bacteroidales bacterium]|nr:FHA domain-containing protein [Bacteroidales bacterium]
MSKILKIAQTCPKCKSRMVIPIAESDLGHTKQVACPKCGAKYNVPIPMAYASKFESDPTLGGNEPDCSLLLEVMANATTSYQTFELTSDYYTIGRKNSGGPEHRPDVEVATADKKMSRKHAAIRKRGKSGFILKDLGSKNGVSLNGNRLDADEELYLSDGDTFRLGETTFRVNIAESSGNDNDLTC